MAVKWSGIVSTIYFSVYSIMMIVLAVFVWIKEEHRLDRTFFKSVWIQRKIYAQIIVYFYDTATDIGVLITWYGLYQDELSGENYERVNMAVFFFGGIAVLILYRICIVVLMIYAESQDNDSKSIYRIILKLPLAILDLYIFEAIYESFKSAEEIIADNIERAEKKRRRIELKKAAKLWEKIERKLAFYFVYIIQGDAKSIFKKIDEENNGYFDKQQWNKMFTSVDGFSSIQIDQCFDILDVSNSEHIKYTEFAKWYNKSQKMKSLLLDKLALEISARYNNDDTGIYKIFSQSHSTNVPIKKTQFFQTVKTFNAFTPTEIDECFNQLDLDESNNIYHSNFIKWYSRAKNRVSSFKGTVIITSKNANSNEDDMKTKKIQLSTLQAEQKEITIDSEEDIDFGVELSNQELEDIDLEDIDPAEIQYYIMLAEAVFESMPQVVLQTVFLMRTIDNPALQKNSNTVLIYTSLIASVFSVANKFYYMDRHGVEDNAKSLKPKFKFPNCFQPWYIIRILWRFCHILCRFALFSLLWIVVGGAPFGIYIFITSFCWPCVAMMKSLGDLNRDQWVLVVMLGSVALPLVASPDRFYSIRWFENIVVMAVTTFFGYFAFQCPLCTDSSMRENISENDAIWTLIILGWTAFAMDAILFIILLRCEIFLDEPRNLPNF